MLAIEASTLRHVVLRMCAMALAAGLAHAAGLRGDAVVWVGFFGSLPVFPIVFALSIQLKPPVTATGDYRDALFEAPVGEAAADSDGTGLDLRMIDSTLGRVHDLRYQARTDVRACPLCGQHGTIDRVIYVSYNGNMRISLLGIERSVVDPGLLDVKSGERLTISRCRACLEPFIEGPDPD